MLTTVWATQVLCLTTSTILPADSVYSFTLRVSYCHTCSAMPDSSHRSITNASTDVLETILCHDTCDVDLRNRLQGDTPLHIAVRERWEGSEGLRLYLGEWTRLKGRRKNERTKGRSASGWRWASLTGSSYGVVRAGSTGRCCCPDEDGSDSGTRARRDGKSQLMTSPEPAGSRCRYKVS